VDVCHWFVDPPLMDLVGKLFSYQTGMCCAGKRSATQTQLPCSVTRAAFPQAWPIVLGIFGGYLWPINRASRARFGNWVSNFLSDTLVCTHCLGHSFIAVPGLDADFLPNSMRMKTPASAVITVPFFRHAGSVFLLLRWGDKNVRSAIAVSTGGLNSVAYGVGGVGTNAGMMLPNVPGGSFMGNAACDAKLPLGPYQTNRVRAFLLMGL